jgi:phage tail tape-measure protein
MNSVIDNLLNQLRELRASLQHAHSTGAHERYDELGEQIDAIEALQIDAQRLNGMRMALCETDRSVQEKMGAAVEAFIDANEPPDTVTPEIFNDLFDRALLAACEARQ